MWSLHCINVSNYHTIAQICIFSMHKLKMIYMKKKTQPHLQPHQDSHHLWVLEHPLVLEDPGHPAKIPIPSHGTTVRNIQQILGWTLHQENKDGADKAKETLGGYLPHLAVPDLLNVPFIQGHWMCGVKGRDIWTITKFSIGHMGHGDRKTAVAGILI